MAGTASSFTPSSLGGLPAPKVQLAGIADTKTQLVRHSSDAGTYSLWRYPMVSVMDLSQAQIDAGVYVEMLAYRPHKSPTTSYTNAREGGYVVPVGQIGGVNPLAGLGGGNTRGGSYTSSADRPNHYKVSAHGEQINVWEYLHNRHWLKPIAYTDTTGGGNSVSLLIPTTNWRYASYRAGKTFGYSGQYRPYYFCFRYIMLDNNEWVSGPLSKIVKLTHKVHPFKRDYVQSGVYGVQVNSIDPNFDVAQMACQFETRTPSGSGN